MHQGMNRLLFIRVQSANIISKGSMLYDMHLDTLLGIDASSPLVGSAQHTVHRMYVEISRHSHPRPLYDQSWGF